MDLARLAVDQLDEKILQILREDARVSNSEIARRVGLTEGAVRRRIQNLRSQGVILAFTTLTAPRGTDGILLIRCAPGSTPRVREELTRSSSLVFECGGEYDIGIWLERGSVRDLNQTLDWIRSREGVLSTLFLVRLSQTPPTHSERPVRNPDSGTGSSGPALRASRAPEKPREQH